MSIVFRLLPALLLMTGYVSVVSAQSLLEHLMYLRTARIAQIRLGNGRHPVPVLPPDPFQTRSDSLYRWFMSLREKEDDLPVPLIRDPFLITSWHKISFPETPHYASRFDSTRWAFIGSTSLSKIDTLETRDIRARLEAQFGRPTLTLVERALPEAARREDYIEFEYWFILNNEIPLILIDVNGPWDRGIVVAAPAELRDDLRSIKSTFLGQLTAESTRKPFADYYYNFDRDSWYVTGFNGASFFDVRTARPPKGTPRPDPTEYYERDSIDQEFDQHQ